MESSVLGVNAARSWLQTSPRILKTEHSNANFIHAQRTLRKFCWTTYDDNLEKNYSTDTLRSFPALSAELKWMLQYFHHQENVLFKFSYCFSPHLLLLAHSLVSQAENFNFSTFNFWLRRFGSIVVTHIQVKISAIKFICWKRWQS